MDPKAKTPLGSILPMKATLFPKTLNQMKQIIKSPYITERSMLEAARGWFTFVVDKDSHKKEITQVVNKEYKVHVVEIKTIIVKGKVKKTGRKKLTAKKAADFKKAIVKLKQGEKIDAFDVGEKTK